MSQDYTGIFWVGHQNPRFPTARSGYLPALEPKEILEDIPEPRFKDRQWDIVTRLRLDQINLRKKLYETLKEIKAKNASKGKTNRYNKYIS